MDEQEGPQYQIPNPTGYQAVDPNARVSIWQQQQINRKQELLAMERNLMSGNHQWTPNQVAQASAVFEREMRRPIGAVPGEMTNVRNSQEATLGDKFQAGLGGALNGLLMGAPGLLGGEWYADRFDMNKPGTGNAAMMGEVAGAVIPAILSGGGSILGRAGISIGGKALAKGALKEATTRSAAGLASKAPAAFVPEALANFGASSLARFGTKGEAAGRALGYGAAGAAEGFAIGTFDPQHANGEDIRNVDRGIQTAITGAALGAIAPAAIGQVQKRLNTMRTASGAIEEAAEKGLSPVTREQLQNARLRTNKGYKMDKNGNIVKDKRGRYVPSDDLPANLVDGFDGIADGPISGVPRAVETGSTYVSGSRYGVQYLNELLPDSKAVVTAYKDGAGSMNYLKSSEKKLVVSLHNDVSAAASAKRRLEELTSMRGIDPEAVVNSAVEGVDGMPIDKVIAELEGEVARLDSRVRSKATGFAKIMDERAVNGALDKGGNAADWNKAVGLYDDDVMIQVLEAGGEESRIYADAVAEHFERSGTKLTPKGSTKAEQIESFRKFREAVSSVKDEYWTRLNGTAHTQSMLDDLFDNKHVGIQDTFGGVGVANIEDYRMSGFYGALTDAVDSKTISASKARKIIKEMGKTRSSSLARQQMDHVEKWVKENGTRLEALDDLTDDLLGDPLFTGMKSSKATTTAAKEVAEEGGEKSIDDIAADVAASGGVRPRFGEEEIKAAKEEGPEALAAIFRAKWPTATEENIAKQVALTMRS